MRSIFSLVSLALSLHTIAAQPQSQDPPVIHPLVRLPLAFENLAIRRSGQILATTNLPIATLYQIDPLNITTPQRIVTFPSVGAVNGITEAAPDIYYVVGGNLSTTNPAQREPDSYRVFEVDLRNGRTPDLRVVAHVPGGGLLNGAVLARPHIPSARNETTSGNLLIADSFAGLIWNVELSSGCITVALNDSTTRAPASPTTSSALGVNGVKVVNETLYYTNTGRATIYRVPVDEQGYPLNGTNPTALVTKIGCDDLLVEKSGDIYVPSPEGVINRISPSGERTIIAGVQNATMNGPYVLGGPTAVAFGRLQEDAGSLYITTNGGLPPASINGTTGVSRVDIYSVKM